MRNGIFQRTELLLGQDQMDRLARRRVIVFGVGGVGSWCAESLVRTGIGALTIVDSDRICVTNVNRQLMATSHTVGQVKVEALKTRLLEICPSARIEAVQQIYDETTAEQFHLHTYDGIVDAIDSLSPKIHLMREATATDAHFVSSMGAACKLDPTRIRVADFWKVQGCPLAAAVRRRVRRDGSLRRGFLCVYSDEVLPNLGEALACGSGACLCPHDADGPGDPALARHEWCSAKARINGSLAHITAIFGFTLSGLLIQAFCAESSVSSALNGEPLVK